MTRWVGIGLALSLAACGPQTASSGADGGAAGAGGEAAGGDLEVSTFGLTGICPGDAAGHVRVNMVLLSDDLGESLGDEALEGGDALAPERFQFTWDNTAGGLAEPLAEGDAARIELATQGVRYVPTAAEPEARRLVVFLMDSSGSLVGQDPRTGAVDVAAASDRRDERIVFFQQLLGGVGEDTLASLVWFNDAPVLRPETAAPTLVHESIAEGLLNVVQFQEEGTSRLAPALDAVLDQIIAANAHVAPLVVLFTDGADDEGALDAVTARYAEREEGPVPVVVLDLEPKPASGLPMGRSPALQALACRTGGDYLFLEHADEFTRQDRNLLPVVAARLRGAWQLDVAVDAGEAQPAAALVSTTLKATLGGETHSASYQATPADTRLLLPTP